MDITTSDTYHPEHMCYVTEMFRGDKRVGYVQWSANPDKEFRIESIRVHNTERKQGFGGSLMSIARDRAIALECHTVYLDETLDGGVNNLFFQNMGFYYYDDDNAMKVDIDDFDA